MIRVFKTGRHARRTPLSYTALAPLFADHITLVDSPDQADLYVFAHVLDLEDIPLEVIEDWRRRRRPVVLLSEEPFWDTIWCRHPLKRHHIVKTRYGALPVIQLNHQTSAIFRFERIPYYLLTNHRFATTYAHRFTRNARLSPRDWKTAFETRAKRLVFMFERRPESYHDLRWPEGGVIGLCAWRTNLALAFTPDEAKRIGQSWHGGQTRFELPDWHLAKMVALDGRTRILAAVENTHSPHYLTEKLFDAFACGALPLYYASPNHRIHGLGLPENAWLNLYGLSPKEAADRVREFAFDDAFFEAYRAAQQKLEALFTDPVLIVAERTRLQQSVIRELSRILENR